LYDATASTDKQLQLVASPRHGIDLLQHTPALQRLLDEFLCSR
jgi:hypothetical protein